MNRSQQIRAGLTIAVILFSIYGLMPTFKALSISGEERETAKSDPVRTAEIAEIDAKAIRRGLDLKGGMYLVLEVDQEDMNASEAQNVLNRVKTILTNRIDRFGVSEPEITTFGSSRIVVKLPGLQDPERAKNLLGSTAQLEFRMVRPESEIQDALDAMDGLFKGADLTTGEAPETTDPAAAEEMTAAEEPAADETAAAEDDTSANPFGDIEDMVADDAQQDEDFLKDHPFSGLIVAQPGVLATPLFVNEADVLTIQGMLDDPRIPRKLRNSVFQLGSEAMEFGNDLSLRPLYLVDSKPGMTGDHLKSARPTANPDRPGTYQVSFALDSRGSRIFGKLTGENVGRFLAISLDERISSAPRIDSRINGQGVITGSFSNLEAEDLANLLEAGALPVDIFIAEERTVGPSLGSDSIRNGVSAALYGSILVIIFMLIYYRLSGLVTVIALVSNILILMAILGQAGLVLTLPGIAGIILTVGMAVDANVLINERIREELRKQKTIRASVQSGYANATRTILDANITTLIAGGILWMFGSGPIKGFAVTLSIGIATSVFTALVMTRLLMELATRNKGQEKMSI